MIDIAERLSLFDDDVSKPFFVESAKQKWHIPAAFTWRVTETEILIPSVGTPSAPEQPLMQSPLAQEPIPKNRCRECGTILPEDIADGLCYVCACLNIGYFDQEPNWPWTRNSSNYSIEDLSFTTLPDPNFDEVLLEDTSDSLLENLSIGPDSDTIGVGVNFIEQAARHVPTTLLSQYDDHGFDFTLSRASACKRGCSCRCHTRCLV